MYNKSEIMKNAWFYFNRSKRDKRNHTFSACLKAAWEEAKKAIAKAAKRAEEQAIYEKQFAERKVIKANSANFEIMIQINAIESQRFNLSMKDHWSNSDLELDSKYSRQITELKAKLVA